VEVSDVPVPVLFAAGMKLLFISNVTCFAGSLCNALLKNITAAHLAASIEDRCFVMALVDDEDEDGFDRCVCIRAVKGRGVFLLDGGKSGTQVLLQAECRVSVRFPVCSSVRICHHDRDK
jgi:hypothetical protein